MKTSNEADTLVLGAGAAGLAAAHELATSGHHVLILEARDRIGGRVFPSTAVFGDAPIELGAEFVHGESRPVLHWLRRAGQPVVDAGRERWMLEGDALRRAEPTFDRLHARLARAPAPRPGQALADYLAQHRRRLGPALGRLARSLAEGFDAADATTVSALEVLAEWRGGASTEAPTFRPGSGFEPMLRTLDAALPRDHASLWRGSVVRSVRWRKGDVEVHVDRHGERIVVRAPQALVTFPLGVLAQPEGAAGAVRFEPPLSPKRAAMARLGTGPVVKAVLRFARPFWEQLEQGRYRDAAFFLAPDAPFPTFWTSVPVRTPTLVAWAAGPAAVRLRGMSQDEWLPHVHASLRRLFGRRIRSAALLEAVAWHDWQEDPFARGAYSHVLAGGAGARRALAAPLEDTLYFAGEACDTRGEAGTVGGALESGQRAARQILRHR